MFNWIKEVTNTIIKLLQEANEYLAAIRYNSQHIKEMLIDLLQHTKNTKFANNEPAGVIKSNTNELYSEHSYTLKEDEVITKHVNDKHIKDLYNIVNTQARQQAKKIANKRREFFTQAFEKGFIYHELEQAYKDQFKERTPKFYDTINHFAGVLGYRLHREKQTIVKYKADKI